MRYIGLGVALVLLSGCVGNDSLYTTSISEKNIYNITRLSFGMTKDEVLGVMNQPYSHQSFELSGDSYDVWFYVTSPTVLGQTRMVPQNLTPLTFKNGELSGWGFNYYNWLVQQEKNGQSPSSKEPETEDTGLEKALQTPSKNGQKSPPSNKQQQQPSKQKQQPSKQQQQPSKSTPSNKKPVSMSSKPKQQQPQEDEDDDASDEDKSKKQQKKQQKDQDKKQPPFKKDDQDMIEEESDQNFDYW